LGSPLASSMGKADENRRVDPEHLFCGDMINRRPSNFPIHK
jgi:hypothetical protein